MLGGAVIFNEEYPPGVSIWIPRVILIAPISNGFLASLWVFPGAIFPKWPHFYFWEKRGITLYITKKIAPFVPLRFLFWKLQTFSSFYFFQRGPGHHGEFHQQQICPHEDLGRANGAGYISSRSIPSPTGSGAEERDPGYWCRENHSINNYPYYW